jgi:hypothetical protein
MSACPRRSRFSLDTVEGGLQHFPGRAALRPVWDRAVTSQTGQRLSQKAPPRRPAHLHRARPRNLRARGEGGLLTPSIRRRRAASSRCSTSSEPTGPYDRGGTRGLGNRPNGLLWFCSRSPITSLRLEVPLLASSRARAASSPGAVVLRGQSHHADRHRNRNRARRRVGLRRLPPSPQAGIGTGAGRPRRGCQPRARAGRFASAPLSFFARAATSVRRFCGSRTSAKPRWERISPTSQSLPPTPISSSA